MAVGCESFTGLERVSQGEDNVLPLNWWLLLVNKYVCTFPEKTQRHRPKKHLPTFEIPLLQYIISIVYVNYMYNRKFPMSKFIQILNLHLETNLLSFLFQVVMEHWGWNLAWLLILRSQHHLCWSGLTTPGKRTAGNLKRPGWRNLDLLGLLLPLMNISGYK